MKAKGMWRFHIAKRWLKYRHSPSALILMYHRVSDLSNDPNLLAVTPDHFAMQLEVIRKHSSAISLQQLTAALQAGAISNRSVVLTFDDGYADNLYHAKPLLERYELPATVFVTAGQVGSQREFWWDELDRILLQPGILPEKLQMRLNGRAYEWLLAKAATYTEKNYQQDRSWHIERKDIPSPRHRLFLSLYNLLRSLPVAVRQNILDDLVLWAGTGASGRTTHQTLTSDELLLLDKDGLFEVGAHTLTHPNMATLSIAEQRNEIRKGQECLEAILKHAVTSFAYPNGSSTKETMRILDELGFHCACSSNPDTVRQDANLFQLPRVVVRDWDRETFTRWLRWWIGD